MMIVGKRTGLTQQRSDFAVEPNLAFGYDDLDQPPQSPPSVIHQIGNARLAWPPCLYLM